jgi:peptide/nickel transport system permease protein
MGGLTRGYVIRRVLMWALTVWLGATLIFTIPRLAPGDPIAAMVIRMSAQGQLIENSADLIQAWRERFGLDGPWYVQYLNFLRSCITLDLGYSLTQFPATVWDLISRALPWTIALLSVAVVITFLLGNLIGALLGWRKTPNWLKSMLPITLTFSSIPPFIFGLLLLFLFSYTLDLFPNQGAYDSRNIQPGLTLEFIGSAAYHAVLPAMAIVLTSMGGWALGMRGMMITTDGEDYMILAQAKGLKAPRLFFRYAVRNALLPQLTALALSLGLLVGGSTLIETYFAYPGVGYLLYYAITNGDYTLMQGIVYILILTTATAVLVIDLSYPLIDPRITLQKK